MTNTDERAFLDAIYATPDEDAPRLVFADWLDERGSDDDKARAALIRAQCQAEYPSPASKKRKSLEREAKAILKANADRWLTALRYGGVGHSFQFRRGFLDGLTISPTAFIRHGKRLFELAPTLRTVRFPNAANELTELADSPFLAKLASANLTLMCTCGYCAIDDELRDLFKSKHARNLRHLNVSRDRIDADGAAALARSSNLANLTSLDLSDNPLGPDGVAALAKSKHLKKLTSLVLSRIGLAPTLDSFTALSILAASKHFSSLTRLELVGNGINVSGVAVLATARFFKQLTHLDLSKNRIGETGAKALIGAENDKLEWLDLRGNQLGPRAIKWLRTKFGKRVKV
ncbi:MAG: TIGR02996 domain-containing protein [Planctomycetes bacterium]|nr:TIGR02996 domain-containing protein [Planctomycetota bacterium]